MDDVNVSLVVISVVPVISLDVVVAILVVVKCDELHGISGLSELQIVTPTARFLLLGSRGAGGRSLGLLGNSHPERSSSGTSRSGGGGGGSRLDRSGVRTQGTGAEEAVARRNSHPVDLGATERS